MSNNLYSLKSNVKRIDVVVTKSDKYLSAKKDLSSEQMRKIKELQLRNR